MRGSGALCQGVRMMAFVYLVVGAFIIAAGTVLYDRRRSRRLAAGRSAGSLSERLPPPVESPPEAIKPPPGPPSFGQRLRRVGVRFANLEELGMGPDEYVIHGAPETSDYDYLFKPKPHQLGWIVAVGSHYA